MPLPDAPKRSAPGSPGGEELRDPLQLGIQIVGVTAIFGGIGWWLDRLLHTFPFLMAAGSVLGLFGIIYLTYVRLRASDRNETPSNEESGPRHGGDH